jgi:uncharacterized protein YcgL (UPF0745 family)
MQTSIYKSHKKQDSYIFIEHKDDFSRVPENLLQALGKLEFVMQIELTLARKLALSDSVKVMQALEENGFYLQLPNEADPLALAGKKPPSNTIPEM